MFKNPLGIVMGLKKNQPNKKNKLTDLNMQLVHKQYKILMIKNDKFKYPLYTTAKYIYIYSKNYNNLS